ncbi:MAG: lytic transglycosylase domain-containing protein [Clostridia bacterium]|nr:lytic transglycosylase domain-containing protein [Clostridia bacterium]
MKYIKKVVLIFIITIILLFIFLNFKKVILKQLYPKIYSEYVEEYAREYNLDVNIVFAIIKNESNFDKDVSSNKGAIGLMQIMQETGNEVANKLNISNANLSDAKTNIQIGTKYFSELYKKYNNTELALAAYNAGTGNVDKWVEKGIINSSGDNVENIPFKETNMYVRRVIQSEKIYESLYE